MHRWRRVVFLFGFDLQPVLPVLHHVAIPCSGEASQPGDAHHFFVQLIGIDGVSRQVGQLVLKPLKDVPLGSGDFHELGYRHGPAFRFTCGHDLLPFIFVNLQADKQRPLCLGGFVSFGLDLVVEVVIGHGKSLDVRLQQNVGVLYAAQLVDCDAHVCRALQYRDRRKRRFRIEARQRQMNGDHNVRTHLTSDVYRQVIDQTAVNQHAVAFANRREECGQ